MRGGFAPGPPKMGETTKNKNSEKLKLAIGGRVSPRAKWTLKVQPHTGKNSTCQKNPLWGFEPKCAAAVLLKHTMYKYSDHLA